MALKAAKIRIVHNSFSNRDVALNFSHRVWYTGEIQCISILDVTSSLNNIHNWQGLKAGNARRNGILRVQIRRTYVQWLQRMQIESLSKDYQIWFKFVFVFVFLHTLTTRKKYLTYALLNDFKAWNHVLEALVLSKNDHQNNFLIVIKANVGMPTNHFPQDAQQ